MKRSVILLFTMILAAVPALGSLWALDEFRAVKKATPEQLCVLRGLEREVSAVQFNIQRYREDLEDDPCKLEEGGDPNALECRFYKVMDTGWTAVPLTAENITFYGEKERYFLSELGYIKWDDQKKVAIFRFESKRARLGRGYSVLKVLTGQQQIIDGTTKNDSKILNIDECLPKVEDAKGGGVPSVSKPLAMFVKENLDSGRGALMRFQLTDSDDAQDYTEEMLIDGFKEKVQIVHVRDVRQKINMTRDYLRLLKLMKRRIDWNSRVQARRKAAEIERVLNLK